MKRIFPALLCLLIVSVGGYKLWRAIKYPYSVSVTLNGSVAFFMDNTPIEVILHKYKPTRDDKYNTTGESISFAFPGDMYSYGENTDGGPQWKIKLLIDYYSLEAIEPKLRATFFKFSDEARRIEREISRNEVGVQIYSGITGIAGISYSPIYDDDYKETGQFCDLTIYSDGSDPVFSDPKYQDVDPFTNGEHFYSFKTEDVQNLSKKEALKVLKAQDGFYANCKPFINNRFCNAKTTFEGWDLNYQFPKAELCKWRDTRTHIRDFLSKYVSNRTPPSKAEN